MDIAGIIGAITGVGALAVSVYTTVRTNNRTTEQDKKIRKQEIQQKSREVQKFLMDWIADIREAVDKRDSQTFAEVKRKLEAFMKFGRPDIGHVHESSLSLTLTELKDYNGYEKVASKLKEFHNKALRAKGGVLAELDRIMKGYYQSDEEYQRRTDEKLSVLMEALNDVVKALDGLS